MVIKLIFHEILDPLNTSKIAKKKKKSVFPGTPLYMALAYFKNHVYFFITFLSKVIENDFVPRKQEQIHLHANPLLAQWTIMYMIITIKEIKAKHDR